MDKRFEGTGTYLLAVNCDEPCPSYIPWVWGGRGEYFNEEYFWNTCESYRTMMRDYWQDKFADAAWDLQLGFTPLYDPLNVERSLQLGEITEFFYWN